MKYFQENVMSGSELSDLHRTLLKAVSPLASNLFFHATEDEAETPNHREILAKSAYNLIGICEAVLDRVPEDERERALNECRINFKPVDEGEIEDALDILIKVALGRF